MATNLSPISPSDLNNQMQQMQQQINNAEQQFLNDSDDQVALINTTSPIVFIFMVIIVFALFGGLIFLVYKITMPVRKAKLEYIKNNPKTAAGIMAARALGNI